MTHDETKHPRGHHTNAGSFSKKNNGEPEATLEANKYAHSSPVECDTELAALYVQRSEPIRHRANYQQRLDRHFAELEYLEKWGKHRTHWHVLRDDDIARTEEAIEQLDAEVAEFDNLIAPINDEYERRGRWTRFFLVTNTGGHIHSSMSCNTCFPTTQYAWLPEQSGSDEAETVKLAGDAACTVCFPSAPVADRNNPRPSQLEPAEKRAAREEREAAKAAKEAKRIATGIFAEDGGELREAATPGSRFKGTLIKTERTAEIRAVDHLVNVASRVLYHPNGRELNDYDHQNQATYDIIIAALARKREQTVEEVEAVVQAKADKKFKREYRQ